MSTKKDIIADALMSIVERAQSGGPVTRIGLMASGSELGSEELLNGARLAQSTVSRSLPLAKKLTPMTTLNGLKLMTTKRP